MPLMDHFHAPLSPKRHWHAFHNSWASSISRALNEVLPASCFAEANVRHGIEIDVATSEKEHAHAGRWAPSASSITLPMTALTDVVEVQVIESSAGPVLCAAIELVSPSNKDRPASRDAFINKCVAYLQAGIGLVIVDIVTERNAALHDALLERMAGASPSPAGAALTASSYRPVAHDGQTTLEAWVEVLTLGAALPTTPLWLRGGPCVPLHLEETYARTCLEQRIPTGAD